MGLFLFSISTLANAAKIHVADMQSWVLIQIAYTIVQFGFVGILIGLVNKRRTTVKRSYFVLKRSSHFKR
jgi:hypothetical protein